MKKPKPEVPEMEIMFGPTFFYYQNPALFQRLREEWEKAVFASKYAYTTPVLPSPQTYEDEEAAK